QGDDRGQIQIVVVARAADLCRPGRTVTRADQDVVRLRVVREPVPGSAAAAGLPPLPAPGAGGELHLWVLEAVLGIAGHDVPAPVELAGLGVIRRHEAALAELRAGLADEHAPVGDSRSAGDRIRLVLVGDLDLPDGLARAGINGD